MVLFSHYVVWNVLNLNLLEAILTYEWYLPSEFFSDKLKANKLVD